MSEPVDFEARGKLRVWMKECQAKYQVINALYEQLGGSRVLGDFIKKKNLGRRRVFDRINAKIKAQGGQLDICDLKDNPPIAVWAVLKPRDHVILNDDPRDQQDCVCVNYFSMGWTVEHPRDGAIGEGLWTVEATQHALVRWFQRAPLGRDLSKALFEAHDGVLHWDFRDVPREGEFGLRVGADCWFGEVCAGVEETKPNEPHLHVKLRTYLTFDQVSPERERYLITPSKKFNKYCLGTNWLLPHPLRRPAKIEVKS